MVCFPPVIDANTGILIVGTFPGVQSLEKMEYYGHPRNALWRLVYDVFASRDPDQDYAKRLEFILKHRTGLWDILAGCERKGSLDQAIRAEIPNDFAALLERFPGVMRLLFNGQKAMHWFRKYQLEEIRERCGNLPECLLMPSTSPAHTMRYEEKKKLWRVGLGTADQ